MALRIYIAYHPADYKAARTIGESLSTRFSVYGESISSDADAAAGIGALEEADLHIYLLSPASVDTGAFRERYAISRTHPARTLPILIQPLPPNARVSGNYLDATTHFDRLLPQLERYAAQLASTKQSASLPWHRRRVLYPAVAVLLLALCGVAFALLPRDATTSDAPRVVAEATESVTEEVLYPTSTSSNTPEPTATPTVTETDPAPEATASADGLQDDGVDEAELTPELTEDAEDSGEETLIAEFYADPVDGVAPLTVSVANFSSGEIVEYLWDFDGDGEADSDEADPLPYTYLLPGDYVLTLTVRDADGGEDTYSEYIFVYEDYADNGNNGDGFDNFSSSYLDFIVDPQYGEAPLTVTFQNLSEGTLTNYAWDFDGDGTTDHTSPNPPGYTYNNPGDYEIIVTALDENGEEQTQYGYVTVDPPLEPYAFIFAEPDYGTAPLTVNFTSETDGVITSFAWDFNGDGVTDSTVQNPGNYTYNTPGEYDVTLVATGPGGTFEDYWYIYVEEVEAPFATIGASVYSGTVPLTVTFNDLSTGEITSYAWDFNGDGATDSTAKNPPAHTYTTAGSYNVQLRVTGPGGSSTDTLTIIANPVPVPTARFVANPLSGIAPLTVAFTNQSTGTVNSYAWDFDGNGTTDSTAQNPPAYTYHAPGEYEASLVVTGSGGSSEPYTVTIVVSAPENTPELTPEVTESPSPEVTESPSPEVTESPSPEVTESPSPEVTESPSPEVTESPSPEPAVAAFSAAPTSGIAPLTVLITNTSTGDIALVEWDFEGDGVYESNDPALPSVQYATPGIYVLTLRVTGEDGGQSTVNVPVQVTALETTPEATAEVIP